jgi:hypothetical protein
MAQIKEKRFLVLEADKKNKNHRIFTEALVKSWCKSEKLKDGASGFDIECAIEDIEYDYEFLKDEFCLGRVIKLEMEGKKLYATCQFKISGESPYIDKINNEEGFLDKCAIIPKGKGAVKNQTIQDDYELYGFNFIWLKESAFIEEVAEEAVSAKA